MNRDRFKNPYFYIGIIGVLNLILSTAGINLEDMTSWSILFNNLQGILSNPYTVISIALALLGIWTDPTTPGIKDNAKNKKVR